MSIIGEAEDLAGVATGTWWVKLLPYALGAAAILGALYGAYNWAFDRGSHSRDTEVSKLNVRITSITADLTTAKANAATLEKAVQSQSAAIAQMRADAATREADRAKKDAAIDAAQHTRAQALAAAKPGADKCASASDLIKEFAK